jgi:hypothetical protein
MLLRKLPKLSEWGTVSSHLTDVVKVRECAEGDNEPVDMKRGIHFTLYIPQSNNVST